ncbi:hypothetical protein L195_g044571, partial [Trifolium pratense]
MMSLENRGRVDEVNKYGLALLEKVDKNPTTYEESHCQVLGIYKCLFKVPQQSTTTDEEHCKKLLSFMEKVKIWHRLNCQECAKHRVELIRMLSTYAYLLLPKATFSNMESGIDFCRTILIEYTNSPTLKPDVYK